jgi:hypothetical protein
MYGSRPTTRLLSMMELLQGAPASRICNGLLTRVV